MRNTRAALRYAKAALSISLEQNKEAALAQDMEYIVSVFAENKCIGPILGKSCNCEQCQTRQFAASVYFPQSFIQSK